jgi:hypothetical protein
MLRSGSIMKTRRLLILASLVGIANLGCIWLDDAGCSMHRLLRLQSDC